MSGKKDESGKKAPLEKLAEAGEKAAKAGLEASLKLTPEQRLAESGRNKERRERSRGKGTGRRTRKRSSHSTDSKNSP